MTGLPEPTAVRATQEAEPALPAIWPGWPHLQDCVHCGLCLASCPTYLTTGIEMSSPRGRIAMVHALGDGRAGFSDALVKHLDQCLGCLACETACPSGVVYGHALEETREAIERRYGRSAGDRTMRWLLAWILPYPERLGAALHGLFWYQRLGLSRALRATRILDRLLPSLAGMEALLPAVPSPRERRPLPEVTPAIAPRRGRVGLLTGCAQRHLLPGLNHATARVLSAAGFEVVAPVAQGCCGALPAHGGDLEEARRMARDLLAIFERASVDLVISNAAGCGAAMKRYGHLLRDDPEWRDRASRFAARVRDVSELLAGVAWNGHLRPVPVSVTYHEACHLAHGQRVRVEPRSLLAGIPQLRLVELAESDLCCGSAGTYNLLQPAMAGDLLRRKVARIAETGADYVAAGNIGCLLQIRKGLREAGIRTQAIHPIELMDWALHGPPR